jgi:hypothetical protein
MGHASFCFRTQPLTSFGGKNEEKRHSFDPGGQPPARIACEQLAFISPEPVRSI